ncbi:MAG: DUF5686 family protein [Crocinitomicaceae bacterium]|nr:DUF5686 family protein [Crocinitomicaceae bacterium]
MKNTFILIVSLLFSLTIDAQVTYQIQELGSNEPIPFVKVIPDVGEPFLSDLDGYITLDATNEFVTLKYPHFEDTTILLMNVVGTVLYMKYGEQDVEEVVVVAGDNPAHRIMRQVIDRRKINHPLKNDAFTYKSYSKFKFDLNPDGLAAIPDSTTDSNLIDLRNTFSKQHLFMMESTSKRTFAPPYRDKEEILAYKVSGISDPMFSTFANSFQSFSFYENQFDLLGKQYVNPIARGGISRYLFILQDTTVVNNDTTFTIFYRPRLGKSFRGMTGHLYINTNGYAIEKVIAAPYDDSTGTTLKIIQEYSFVNDEKWFPSKLTTEIDLRSLALDTDIKSAYVIGRGSSYIEEVEINPEIDTKGLNDNIVVETSADAGELSEDEWERYRKYSITDKENETYRFVDSLGEALNFDRFLAVFKILAEGKIPLGKYINLDLQRSISFRNYEGYRLGAGLETSQRLMKNIQFGGYFGWGTRDKEWKYGGHATFHLNKKRGIRLDLRYQQDLLERGGTSFHENFPLLSNDLYRQFFISQMDRQRLGEMVFSWDLKSNIELKLIGNYQRLWFTQDYQYAKLPVNELDIAESGIELTWNILEKSMLIGDRKVSLGKRYPQIRVKAVRGWKGIAESDIDYWRLNAEVSHTTRIGTIGKLQWKIGASKVVGDVPLTLTHNGNGTRQFWNISVPNSFETMLAGSFYTTEQANIFTRFMFRPIRTKAKWNEPRFGLHHAIGFGNFTNREDHQWTFETMDKGFYEAGIILEGILTQNATSIGLGGFYRYGYYSNADWKKNIVPKIVVSFVLN